MLETECFECGEEVDHEDHHGCSPDCKIKLCVPCLVADEDDQIFNQQIAFRSYGYGS